MTEILEYIMLHYTWFLGGAILILLAIIGSYADKTNFGQGKNAVEDNNEDENLILEKKGLEDYVKETSGISVTENNNTEQENIDINVSNSVIESENSNKIVNSNNSVNQQVNSNLINSNSVVDKQDNVQIINNNIENNTIEDKMIELEKNIEPAQQVEINKKQNFEYTFNNFDREFNSVLSKKETISDDLLSDIENISLDNIDNLKTSNINIIPNLDDVELPKIKSVDKNEVDVWKF